jgi:hypothetical protein
MSKEVDITYLDGTKIDSDETIDLGIMPAGEEEEVNLLLKNNINFEVLSKLKVEGDEDVTLINKEVKTKPNSTSPIGFRIKPSLTRMTPIRFKLEMEYTYIVR